MHYAVYTDDLKLIKMDQIYEFVEDDAWPP